jgi:3-oxoacyl-[acyl-carrier protein] reductase
MKIENKVAVVTGASGGIGLATAMKLLDKGVKALALVDISEHIEQTARHLIENSGNPDIRGFCGDVSDCDFRGQVFSSMLNEFGPIQVCVPAAGIIRDGLAVKENRETGELDLYPIDKFKQILDINLLHPTYWAMHTIAGIARHRLNNNKGMWQSDEDIQGSIILIGSVSSRGNRGQVGYAAAKSGLKAVSSTLNIEGLYYGVQTKIIHPGFVDTPMVESVDAGYFEQTLKPKIGLGRKIRPEEIGEIICTMIENPVLSGEVWADASMTPLA